MGTRTVGSHGKSDGLTTKQGPLYNLTLDEVQHQLGDLGRPLSSMNIDDLINTVWTAEKNQSTKLSSADYLRTKTVDELWQHMKKNTSDSDGDNLDRKKTTCEKQPTLGEMTLEDFLAKAGIVAEESSSSQDNKKDSDLGAEESVGLFKQDIDQELAQWMKYQIPPLQQQHVFVPGHHPADVAYPETKMTVSSDAQTPGRKRVASGDLMEKTVERRHKRMIKNRESAARSRARKQAYTHELENKVSRLEEENELLKREQEAEKALPCEPLPEPKYQLRRTSSALF